MLQPPFSLFCFGAQLERAHRSGGRASERPRSWMFRVVSFLVRFGKKVEGPGLLGGSIIYKGNPSICFPKGHLCCFPQPPTRSFPRQELCCFDTPGKRFRQFSRWVPFRRAFVREKLERFTRGAGGEVEIGGQFGTKDGTLTWVWLKINQEGYAGFGPCFHLPGIHFGTGFLIHTHFMSSWTLNFLGRPSWRQARSLGHLDRK